MALLKRRPTVRVRVPREIRPGDEVRLIVVLDCKQALEVNAVNVVLEGTERWWHGDRQSAQRTLLRLAATLSEERVLPAGLTELGVRIPLPKETPPSYRSAAATIEYELKVNVDIPWWPDRNASFELHVVPNELESPRTSPQVYSSDPNGPTGNEAHVELSLASSWTRAGDVVSGAFALSNVKHNRYSEVRIGVRAVENLFGPNGDFRVRRDAAHYQIQLGAEEAREGEMIPFRFRLPSEAHARFGATPRPGERSASSGASPTGLIELKWVLELTVGVRWARDLSIRVPFEVLPESPRPGDAPDRLAPPTVGSDRLRKVWEAVGDELGLRYEAQSLWAHYGQTSLIVRRDHSGQKGIFVTAEIRYPMLHLGLSVEPAGSVRKVVGGGATSGDASWDRRHYARGRDEAQAGALLQRIVPLLQGATLRRLDDESLTVASREAGQSRKRMSAFCRAATDLARTMEEIRQRPPPPDVMRDAVTEWEELSRRMGGTLETARMRIEGTVAGLPTEVRLSFDDASGEPLHTWLSVEPPSPLDDEHALHWLADEDRSPAFKGEALELFGILTQGARELEIEPRRIAVAVDGLLGVQDADETVALTAPALEQRASRMARLITVLRGGAGPYR